MSAILGRSQCKVTLTKSRLVPSGNTINLLKGSQVFSVRHCKELTYSTVQVITPLLYFYTVAGSVFSRTLFSER